MKILSPLVGNSFSYVKNSKEFASFVSSQKIDNNSILVSFDVVSLFTSIPIDRAIEVARKRLLADDSLEERTYLTVDEVCKLLEFCLGATYLAYKGSYYQQTYGTAMGSPVSITVANLVMEDLEEIAISKFVSPPIFWKRYVDDICTALPESLIQQFLDDLNSIEQSIKFTFEVEENEKLAFLDTAITHHKDGSLTTSVYRKKTHTDKYLSFESHHPIAHKLSVVNTLFSRAEGICTTEKDLENEKKHLKKVLELNGYPKNVSRKNVTRNRTINDGEDQEKPIATVVLPYVRNTSECIKRILAKLKIRTCFKPYRTLRKILVHPKDRIKKEDHTGVVYQVSCTTCNESYIGQTGRTMGHRLRNIEGH